MFWGNGGSEALCAIKSLDWFDTDGSDMGECGASSTASSQVATDDTEFKSFGQLADAAAVPLMATTVAGSSLLVEDGLSATLGRASLGMARASAVGKVGLAAYTLGTSAARFADPANQGPNASLSQRAFETLVDPLDLVLPSVKALVPATAPAINAFTKHSSDAGISDGVAVPTVTDRSDDDDDRSSCLEKIRAAAGGSAKWQSPLMMKVPDLGPDLTIPRFLNFTTQEGRRGSVVKSTYKLSNDLGTISDYIGSDPSQVRPAVLSLIDSAIGSVEEFKKNGIQTVETPIRTGLYGAETCVPAMLIPQNFDTSYSAQLLARHASNSGEPSAMPVSNHSFNDQTLYDLRSMEMRFARPFQPIPVHFDIYTDHLGAAMVAPSEGITYESPFRDQSSVSEEIDAMREFVLDRMLPIQNR